MTIAFFVLIQYRSVTDRQTDRRTDFPPLAIPAVCIARYANALVIKICNLVWVGTCNTRVNVGLKISIRLRKTVRKRQMRFLTHTVHISVVYID